jgi:hypothetical protein
MDPHGILVSGRRSFGLDRKGPIDQASVFWNQLHEAVFGVVTLILHVLAENVNGPAGKRRASRSCTASVQPPL